MFFRGGGPITATMPFAARTAVPSNFVLPVAR